MAVTNVHHWWYSLTALIRCSLPSPPKLGSLLVFCFDLRPTGKSWRIHLLRRRLPSKADGRICFQFENATKKALWIVHITTSLARCHTLGERLGVRRDTRFSLLYFFLSILPFLRKKKERSPSLVSFKRARGKGLVGTIYPRRSRHQVRGKGAWFGGN